MAQVDEKNATEQCCLNGSILQYITLYVCRFILAVFTPAQPFGFLFFADELKVVCGVWF